MGNRGHHHQRASTTNVKNNIFNVIYFKINKFTKLNIVYCVASVPKMKMEIYDLPFLERLIYIAAADIIGEIFLSYFVLSKKFGCLKRNYISFFTAHL